MRHHTWCKEPDKKDWWLQKLGKLVTQLALKVLFSLPIPSNFLDTNPFFNLMSQLLQSPCIGSATKVISQGHFPSLSVREGLALVQCPVASFYLVALIADFRQALHYSMPTLLLRAIACLHLINLHPKQIPSRTGIGPGLILHL